MAQTLRTIRFDRTGGPEVLRIDTLPQPTPKGNEVLIHVEAIALNRMDLLWRQGAYFEEPIFPAQIGYEAAGVIARVGPEVHTLKPGDRVSTLPAASLLDYTAHAEVIVYPEHALFVYPPNLNPAEAASVNTAFFAGFFALVETAELKRHQSAVITAASSAMGLAALQIVKATGAQGIAVTRSEKKRRNLVAVGASHVLVSGWDNVQEAVLDLTEGLGADLIYDGVAGPGLAGLVGATKRLSHVIVYGCFGAMNQETTFPLGACFLRGVKVHPLFRIFDFTGHPTLGLRPRRGAIERAKRYLFAAFASERLKPTIDQAFRGLDHYAAAHRYLERTSGIGKVVLELN